MSTKKFSMVTSAAYWACIVGVVLAGGAASAKSSQPVTDSLITTKVKAELIKDRDTKARHIDVDTQNGVVVLKGTVDSATEKQKAEQDARRVKGVLKVTNELSVKAHESSGKAQ